MRYKKNLIVLIFLFSICTILFLASCSSDQSIKTYTGNAGAGFIHMKTIREIPLKIKDHLIGMIDDVKIYEDNILIADTRINNQVYLFDKNGELKQFIGKKGQGLEEYQMPIVGGIYKDNIYVGSIQTMSIAVFDINGEFIENLGVPMMPPWPKFDITADGTFYLLHPTRYQPFTMSIFDKDIQNIAKISRPDEDFVYVFDTFAPSSDFAMDEDKKIYQVFNHKYEVKVMDQDGKLLEMYKLSSPYYTAPDYEKVKKVRGHAAEKSFRSTYTQVVGIFLYRKNILAVVLKNWNTGIEHEDVIEFWQKDGQFVTRYKVNQGEELKSIDGEFFIFIKEGLVDENKGLQNPRLVYRSIELGDSPSVSLHAPK